MKTILITGATSGIGRAAAIHFVTQGHRVVATGRRGRALAELAAHTATLPGELHPLRMDVTDDASIASAAALVERLTAGRGLDVLINNAGYGVFAPLAEVTANDLRRQFDTNVFGLMAVTRAFLPSMIEAGAGRVINVGSIGGRVTFPLMGAYNATKYAVESLSDALRNELAPLGIKVVIVEPGPIKTEFAEVVMAVVDRYRSDDSVYASVYARSSELQRLANKMAADVKVVVRALDRSVHARRPNARYVAPFSSRLMLALLSVIPTPLADVAMRALVGLRAGRMKRIEGARQAPLERAA